MFLERDTRLVHRLGMQIHENVPEHVSVRHVPGTVDAA
jgi:hypothetical protein